MRGARAVAGRICLGLSFVLSFLFAFPRAGSAIDLIERDNGSLSLTGSYTNILSFGEDLNGNDYTSDFNRFRTIWKAAYQEWLELNVTYQQEIFLGSFLDTDEFAFTRDDITPAYFDWTDTILDNPDLFWNQSLYRAYAVVRAPQANLTVGRQRISWGTALFWNPTDVFNPTSPLQIEPDEKVGVDAINLEIPLGGLTLANLVVSSSKKYVVPTPAELLAMGLTPEELARLASQPPDLGLLASVLDEEKTSAVAGRFRTTVGTYDLSLIGGEFDENRFIGANWSGYIKDAGFRGEFTYTFSEDLPDYFRFVTGVDYAFSNTLYFVAEYFYNGQAEKFSDAEVLDAQLAGELVTLNPHFLNFGTTYDLTPLLKLQLYGIWDMKGEGVFVNPEVYYSARANLDVRVGAQLFTGNRGSDFADTGNIYYVKLEWFF